MALRSKWCAFKLAIRWLLIVVCWSVGYLVVHQATQSISPNIRPAGVNRELLSSENESTKHLNATKRSMSTESNSSSSDENPYVNLNVAPGSEVSDIQLIKNWGSKIPSLPRQYLHSGIGYKNKRCASYPKLIDINFNNDIWQEWKSKLSGATFYIFGAYWDNRREKKPAVHLLVMVDRVNPPDVICQLWYGVKGQNTPAAVEPMATPKYTYIWNSKWGNYLDGLLQPYLLTCVLTSRKDPPLSVSLVDKPCDNATNNILVVVEKKEKISRSINSSTKFAVCVKGLNFYSEDVSVRLIEWLELLRTIGAEKVYAYDLAVHPNVSKVLQYYEQQKFVHISPLTLPGSRLNEKPLMNFYFKHQKIFKRQAELIPYNDCFYRHRLQYDHMVLLDIDEVIVPLKDNTWSELLRRLSDNSSLKACDSFHASNVYFFDDSTHSHGWDKDIPPYMHMMQHIWRARNHTSPGAYVKSFFSTQTVLALHNHFPMRCLDNENADRPCKTCSIDVNFAQLQHYRKDCDANLKKTCKSLYHKYLVNDDNLQRFLEPVVDRTKLALFRLGFINHIDT